MTNALTKIVATIVAVVVLCIGVYFYMSDAPPNQILVCKLPESKSVQHPGMVWVPPGEFQMGSEVYSEETPTRIVAVDGFWIDQTEVTNQQFAEFVAATNYVTEAEKPGQPGAAVFVVPTGTADLSSPASWWRYAKGANWRHPSGEESSIEGREQFPVVAITAADALAYAKWKGRDLPTEEQWERAARAGIDSNETSQPKNANTWQGIFPLIDTAEDRFTGIAPVGCYNPNAFGIYDMIGNVWELTRDTYINHTVPAYVIKGGSFLCAPNYCMRYRPAARQAQEAGLGTNHVGFRTVLNPQSTTTSQ